MVSSSSICAGLASTSLSFLFFFSSRRRHTRYIGDWSSDVCSSDLVERFLVRARELVPLGELFVIPVARAGQYRLRVIFGEFPSRAAAIEAGKRLPPRYQQAFRASPRSFAELRGQI